MSPQWMPQNIQKRLLLYVLQQLSLFSEIDLPNLEQVSLNNIHLKDIPIDADKVGKIPGYTLRHGKVGNLELNGGVMGGVNIDMTDIDLVVAPNFDSMNDDSNNQPLFLLAQSTAELANTMMLDKEELDEKSHTINSESEDEDEDEEYSEDEIKKMKPKSSRSASTSSTKSKPSALTGVMNRAVEIALLRLQIKVLNLNIKIVTELTDLLIQVDEALFKTVNGVRSLSVGPLRVIVLKPEVNPGEFDPTEKEDSKDEKKKEDEEDEEEEDEDDEEDDEGYGEESLMDSMVFTHEEASSIYMSATSQSFDKTKEKGAAKEPSTPHIEKKPEDFPVLFHIDSIYVEFEGHSPISNLSIDINNVKISNVPLTPTISSVFTSVSRALKVKIHQLRKQNITNRKSKSSLRFPQYADDDELTYDDEDLIGEENESADLFFNRLHINNFILSVTSSLRPTGEFASQKNNLLFNMHNINIKQKNDILIYGGIEEFKIIKITDSVAKDVFKFESTKATPNNSPTPDETNSSPQPPANTSKADVRFELFKKVEQDFTRTEITTLFSKQALIDLDSPSLLLLINFIIGLSTTYSSYNAMKTAMNTLRETTGMRKNKNSEQLKNLEALQFILQSSSTSISLKLSESLSLKGIIFPVSLNLLNNNMSIQKILISIIDNSNESSLLTLSNVQLITLAQDFKSFSYRNSSTIPREFGMSASSSFIIDKIKGSITFFELKRLIKGISGLIDDLRYLSHQINALEKSVLTDKQNLDADSHSSGSSALLQNSIYFKQRRSRRPVGNFANNSMLLNPNRSASPTPRILIKSIEFKITQVFPKFGDLIFNSNQIVFHKLNNDIHGFILSLEAYRSFENGSKKDHFIYEYQKTPASSIKLPLILIQVNRSEKMKAIDIILKNFAIEYYTHWLQLFEKELNQDHSPDAIVEKVQKSAPMAANTSDRLEVHFTTLDCVLGLNPGRLPSKLLVVVGKGNLDLTVGTVQLYVKSSLRDCNLLLVDDMRNMKAAPPTNLSSNIAYISPVAWLNSSGFHSIGFINCTHVGITINTDIESIKKRNEKFKIPGNLSLLDLKVNSDDHQLDLCADSAHVLIQIVNDLRTPVVLNDDEKFRINVLEPCNLLNDIEDEFKYKSHESSLSNSLKLDNDSLSESRKESQLNVIDEYYNDLDKDISKLSISSDSSSRSENKGNTADESGFSFDEDHFSNNVDNNEIKVYPVKLNVNLSKTKILLYDGYDWKQTRKAIKGAVKRVEDRARRELERKKRLSRERRELKEKELESLKSQKQKKSGSESKKSVVQFADVSEEEENHNKLDKESVIENEDGFDNDYQDIGETLFASVHLSLPKGSDPSDLATAINSEVQNDEEISKSENNIQKDTQVVHNIDIGKSYKNLRLRRSKYHKVMIDLKNIEVNVTVVSTRDPRIEQLKDSDAQYEVVNSVDFKLDNLDIIDNVPTSTWNKFITYMNSLGEREVGTSMLKFSLINVRPDIKLCGTEAMMNVSVLPLRLHIDQDTLDFISRFTQFKDNRFLLPIDDIIYIKKFQMSPIKLKLDYKPKKFDYSGIRSGNHAEFMNIFILDGSTIKLPEATIHGVLGIPKLGNALKDVWTPSIQQTQLAGILSGLSPIRSIVNIGGGVKSLVAIPIQEYKKDGRLMRSLQKGTTSFARTTGYELLKLGVKLASGTQIILEQSEEFLGGEGASARLPSNVQKKRHRKRKNHEFRRRSNDDEFEGQAFNRNREKGHEQPNLMASSLLLNKRVGVQDDQYGSKKLYSYIELDETHDIDEQILNLSSALMLNKRGRPQNKGILRNKSNPDSSAEYEEFDDLTDEYTGEDFKEDDFDEEEDYEVDEDEEDYTEAIELSEEDQAKLISLYSNQPENTQEGIKSAYKLIGKNLKSTKKSLSHLRREIEDAETIQDSLVSVFKSSPVILIRPLIGTTEALLRAMMGLSNDIDSRHIIETKDKYKLEKQNE